MAHNQRGKRAGRKGNPFTKSLRQDALGMTNTGSTSGVVATGKKGYSPAYFECFDGEETKDDFVIPRRSLTFKQNLASKPIQMEFEDRHGRQLDKVSKKLVHTSDQRLVWKSDRTLLSRAKPDTFKPEVFKRVTSRSKERVRDQDSSVPSEMPPPDKLGFDDE